MRNGGGEPTPTANQALRGCSRAASGDSEDCPANGQRRNLRGRGVYPTRGCVDGAQDSVAWTIRSNVSQNSGRTPQEFHTWVMPPLMRMREFFLHPQLLLLCSVHVPQSVWNGSGDVQIVKKCHQTVFSAQ